jgi:hypothetical protein
MGKHAFSLDSILAGWQPDGETRVRHPHSAPDSPGLVRWDAASVQRAVGWLATVQTRAAAGVPVTPKLDIRLRAAGFKLEQDALNRWRATHASGLITAWADNLPTLHAWLLSTAQPPTQTPGEASDGPTTT